MVRLVSIDVPRDREAEVMAVLLPIQKKFVYYITTLTVDDNVRIRFKVKNKHLQTVLDEIEKSGCGKDYGVIDVMTLLMSRPALVLLGDPSLKKKRAYRVSERISLEEISGFIESANHLTFNYILLLTSASVIAGIALLFNKNYYIIASMLVSPLMGPIRSIMLGLAVENQSIIRRGIRNEIVGIVLPLIVGVVIGFFASFAYSPQYRSEEMISRGQPMTLLSSFFVSIFAGTAVVLVVTMGGAVNALVGTVISASLLPPIVNCGMCLVMGMKYRMVDGNKYDGYEYSMVGVVSLSLFLINFFSMVLFGYLCLRYLKKIRPPNKTTTQAT